MCVPLVECNREATIALLFVAVTLNGGTGAGYEVNILDVAPNYAGTVYGLINSLGSLPAFIAPMTIGAITNGKVSYTKHVILLCIYSWKYKAKLITKMIHFQLFIKNKTLLLKFKLYILLGMHILYHE